MLSFDDYKRINNNVGTVGQQLKVMSDEVMQITFDNDIGTRQCYIYDHYHDDQADIEYGYNPALSRTKIPVKLKFIVKTYKSMAKEDPEYHILFEPDVWNSMSCKPDWFVKNYERFGVEFPVGLYCDIPDDRGVYHRWIIMYLEVANQFPKLGVLRCNYRFKWIENDGVYRHKRKIWGINATQNSYTSGVWTDFKTSTYDDQDKFYLPWNPITSELVHDTRIIISMLKKRPWVYRITKVDDTATRGLLTFTIKQDRFEPDHDYISIDPKNKDYGDMYADYFESDVKPCVNDDTPNCDEHIITIETVNDNVKLGSSKVLTAKVYDSENNDITDLYKNSKCDWSFELVSSRSNLIEIERSWLDEYKEEYIECNKVKYRIKYRFKCKFKFNGDEQYLGYNIKASCTIDDMTSNVLLDIVPL